MSEYDYLPYPVGKVRDSGVNSGLVRQRAADAPRDDANQRPLPRLRVLQHQWSTRVTLAGVLASLSQAGADEDVGDVLDEACLAVHAFALLVGDDGHAHLLHHARQGPVFVQAAPAGDDGRPAHEGVVGVRHADGHHVVLEGHGLVEAQQRQVVLEGAGVEARVGGHDLHAPLQVGKFLAIALQVVLAQPQQDVVGRHVVHAVGRANSPIFVDESGPALVQESVPFELPQGYHPRPLSKLCLLASHYPRSWHNSWPATDFSDVAVCR